MELIGAFYFQQCDSGNLIGEFTNNTISCISTESADIISKTKNRFIGKYNTTWHEDKEAQNLTLIIDTKKNTTELIYELTWENEKGKVIFEGQGFITDNKLIGYYTAIEKTLHNTV